MKAAVLIKTASGGAINDEDAFWRTGRVLPGVLGPFDAHAAEAGLRLRESGVVDEVIVVALAGSSDVLGAVRDVLALGADRAILLADPAINGADIAGRARILAALLAREQVALCIACPWNGDIDMTLLLAATAVHMGSAFLSQARKLEAGGDGVIVERQSEDGDVTLTAAFPCIVEVTETINKARYPTIKGKMDAKRKPLGVLTIADLGLETANLRTTGIRGTMLPEPRTPPVVIDDPALAPEHILAFLEERRLLG